MGHPQGVLAATQSAVLKCRNGCYLSGTLPAFGRLEVWYADAAPVPAGLAGNVRFH